MKITFVYPNINKDLSYKRYVYLGIGYLSAVLKRTGHGVSLIQITRQIRDSEFINYILNQRPDIVAFTATTNMFPFVRNWSRLLKEESQVLTICGGPHATIEPETTIETEGIDMVCVGEGEGAIVELCSRLEEKGNISNISNIWLKENGVISKNPPRPLIGELDALPFPDRDIFDYENTDEVFEGVYRLMASRGCPYNCSYCFNHTIRGIYRGKGRYVRFRSPLNVITELEYALKEYKHIRYFHFVDDILTVDRHWFKEFVELYKTKIPLPYICQVHPNLINEEVVKLLRESNCFQVQVGIESGNDYIRNDILDRCVSRQQIIRAFDLCKRHGLKTYAYNMVGLPFESKSRVLDTIKVNAQINPDIIHTSIFYPYPKTKLYNLCKDNKLLKEREVYDYFSETILSFEPQTKDFIVFSQRFFVLIIRCYYRLYKLRKPFCDIGLKCFDSLMFCSPFIKLVNLSRYFCIRIRDMHRRLFQFMKRIASNNPIKYYGD